MDSRGYNWEIKGDCACIKHCAIEGDRTNFNSTIIKLDYIAHNCARRDWDIKVKRS